MKGDDTIDLFTAVCALTSFLLGGITIKNLWNWFIAPLGVKEVKYLQALGIDVLVTYLVMQTTVYQPLSKENALKLIGVPLAALLQGAFIKAFQRNR